MPVAGEAGVIVVHGIPNCDSVRATRRWLTERGVDHATRDLRTDPPTTGEVSDWAAAVGWERLLNRRGTTWRTLSRDMREGLDEAAAVALMITHPLLIKRPVINWGDGPIVGVDEAEWETRWKAGAANRAQAR